MRTGLLFVGSELLDGSVENTNASYIQRKLFQKGVSPAISMTVIDDADLIAKAARWCLEVADVLIVTGGLGPTQDDLTREGISTALGRRLYRNEEIASLLLQRMPHGVEPQDYLRQADLIEGATYIMPVGTAPGMRIEHEGKLIFVLPGVPREMQTMFDKSVLEEIGKTALREQGFAYEEIRFLGAFELEVQKIVDEIKDRFPLLRFSFLPQIGEVALRICGTAPALQRDELLQQVAEASTEVTERLTEFVYSRGQRVEEAIGELLRSRGLTLSAAESCTGGTFASRVTRVPGASDYFLGSAVTYSNESKVAILGVREETLRNFGAVSSQTAIEMAQGALKKFGSNIAVSSTGIAGPTGATVDKPVGLVYTGFASEKTSFAIENRFSGDRELIIYRTTQKMFDMIRRHVIHIEGN